MCVRVWLEKSWTEQRKSMSKKFIFDIFNWNIISLKRLSKQLIFYCTHKNYCTKNKIIFVLQILEFLYQKNIEYF